MLFQQAIQEGLIKADLVLAVPRSVSSALARALSISPDYKSYLFEPFDYRHQVTAERPLESLQKSMVKTGMAWKKSSRVLVKAIADSFDNDHFSQLAQFCGGLCLLVRDPQSQAFSAFRAISRLDAGRNATSEEFRKLKRKKSFYFWDFITSPWEEIRKQSAYLGSGDRYHNWCVLDGDLVRVMPNPTLHHICREWGITYSPDMIDGWSEPQDKTVGMYDDRYRYWMGRVQQSNGLSAPSAMTPRLEDFSSAMRPYIAANLRTYVYVLCTAPALLPDQRQIDDMMQKQALHLTCPIACFTWTALCEDTLERKQALREIRTQKPEYESSYKIIAGSVAALRHRRLGPVRQCITAQAA